MPCSTGPTSRNVDGSSVAGLPPLRGSLLEQHVSVSDLKCGHAKASLRNIPYNGADIKSMDIDM